MRVTVNYGLVQRVLHLYDVRTLGDVQVQILTKLNIPICQVYFIVHEKGIIGSDLAFSLPISYIDVGETGSSTLTLIKNEQGLQSSYKGNIPGFVDYIISNMMLSFAGSGSETSNIFARNFDACVLLRKYLRDLHDLNRDTSLNDTRTTISAPNSLVSRTEAISNLVSSMGIHNDPVAVVRPPNTVPTRNPVQSPQRAPIRNFPTRSYRNSSTTQQMLQNINTRHAQLLARTRAILGRRDEPRLSSTYNQAQQEPEQQALHELELQEQQEQEEQLEDQEEEDQELEQEEDPELELEQEEDPELEEEQTQHYFDEGFDRESDRNSERESELDDNHTIEATITIPNLSLLASNNHQTFANLEHHSMNARPLLVSRHSLLVPSRNTPMPSSTATSSISTSATSAYSATGAGSRPILTSTHIPDEIEYNFLIDTETNEVTPVGSNNIASLPSDPYLLALSELGQVLANQVAQNLTWNQLEDVPITISEAEFEIVSKKININSNQNTDLNADRIRDGNCSICLCELKGHNNLRKLTVCGHQFHHNCIKTQLVEFNCRCPTCRADVRESLNKS